VFVLAFVVFVFAFVFVVVFVGVVVFVFVFVFVFGFVFVFRVFSCLMPHLLGMAVIQWSNLYFCFLGFVFSEHFLKLKIEMKDKFQIQTLIRNKNKPPKKKSMSCM
jgi:hypothetical protein